MAVSQNRAIFRQEFVNNLRVLIGEHPSHNLIADLLRPVNGGGESTWIPGVNPVASDDAATKAFYDDATMKKYYESGDTQDFDAWIATRTPHMATQKETTFSEGQLVDWGNSWNLTEDADWLTIVDPKSADMQVCAQKMHKAFDVIAGKGIAAASVQRKIKDMGGTQATPTLTTVSLPTTQVLPDLVYADANVDTIPSAICEIMGNAYMTAGMPIYCAISTTLARNLKKNDNDAFRSRDFISSYSDYRNGTFQPVEGVTFIVMPKTYMDAVLAPEAQAQDARQDHYFAWSPQAVANVNYDPLRINMDNDPGAKFNEVAYASQILDAVRTDDLGVAVGEIVWSQA